MSATLRPRVDFAHRCEMETLGAHVLHVGHKPIGEMPYPNLRLPIREERLVRQCRRCRRFLVKVRRFLVYGAGPRIVNGRLRTRLHKNQRTYRK